MLSYIEMPSTARLKELKTRFGELQSSILIEDFVGNFHVESDSVKKLSEIELLHPEISGKPGKI